MISTHTLRGERDDIKAINELYFYISTHTLRGERDEKDGILTTTLYKFQLTRSVGSVTYNDFKHNL